MSYNSKIANIILRSPFDDKALVDTENLGILSKEDFITFCYVNPKFNKNVDDLLADKYMDIYDIKINPKELKEQFDAQKKEEKKFFDWLNDSQNKKIYTISGNAGTGKTTYIQKIKHDREDDRKWIILDVENAPDFITWFGDDKAYIGSFSKIASYKLYSIILKKISGIFFDFQDKDGYKDIAEIRNNLKRMIDIFFDELIKFYPPKTEFFEGLSQVYSDNEDNITIVRKLSKYLNGYFNNLIKKTGGYSYVIWREALDVLLLTLRCYYGHNSKIVIVFDNIERFIAHDEIYNEEVDEIRKELNSYNKYLCESYHCHKGIFKFIIALRSSSERMCNVKKHSSDELPSNLDISDWFDIDKIINKKTDWYKNCNGYLSVAKTINILEQIVGDIRTCKKELTGLQLQIDPLFNNNKRLIIDFIGQILEKDKYKKYIAKYRDLWNENTPISRFAARSIIRGLILDSLDSNDNLFKQLRLYSKRNASIIHGVSYTRKILTVLYNKKDEDIALTDVLSQVCSVRDIVNYWNNELSNDTKDDISTVLFYMNSYNRRVNDWIQFIDMQINNANHSVCINNPHHLRKLLDKNMQNFTLRIMPAGEAYLRYIVASFEYFSYRYHGNCMQDYKPLFATVPSLEEIKYDINELRKLDCYKIINNVKTYAVACIEYMKRSTDIDIIINKNANGKSHIKRIIEHHQGYINKFIAYLEELYGMQTCENLVDLCRQVKNEYNKL